MRSIAVVGQKGGSCKTTSVVNVAACMAGQGSRVLVIDADTQSNATYFLLGGQSPRRPTLADVLTGDASAESAIVPTTTKGIDLIPSESALADVNVSLAGEVGRERRLRSAMSDMSRAFDVCLIDTGPGRSLLTTNVLNYVHEVIVPIGPGLFGFLGLAQLQTDMNQIRRFLENKALALTGVFLVMMEKNNVCRDFELEMRRQFGEVVFNATIPRSVKFEESNARLTSIFEHTPKSPGALAYKALTKEVMNRGERTKAKRADVAGGNHGQHSAA